MAKPARPPDLGKKSLRWLQSARRRASHNGDDAEVHAITEELQRRRAAMVMARLPEDQLQAIMQAAKELGFIRRLPRRS